LDIVSIAQPYGRLCVAFIKLQIETFYGMNCARSHYWRAISFASLPNQCANAWRVWSAMLQQMAVMRTDTVLYLRVVQDALRLL